MDTSQYTIQQTPTAGVDIAATHLSSAPIIQVKGISKVHASGIQIVTAVSDITFQINYGDFVAIFGPSGAGKSTLLHILLGIEEPDIGEVIVKDESLYGFNQEDRGRIRMLRFGYVPQQQYWLDRLNLLDNVALPLIIQGGKWRPARAKALTVLERVGLLPQKAFHPLELSTGQQQKASIARSLMNDPWIIFADEPTEHLDTTSAEEVVALLEQLNKVDRRTVIMVTHHLQFLKVANRRFFMQDGRIWDMRNRKSPFTSIKEAIAYVDEIEEGKAEE